MGSYSCSSTALCGSENPLSSIKPKTFRLPSHQVQTEMSPFRVSVSVEKVGSFGGEGAASRVARPETGSVFLTTYEVVFDLIMIYSNRV